MKGKRTLPCAVCAVWTCGHCGWQANHADPVSPSHVCLRCGCRQGSLVPNQHLRAHRHLQATA